MAVRPCIRAHRNASVIAMGTKRDSEFPRRPLQRTQANGWVDGWVDDTVKKTPVKCTCGYGIRGLLAEGRKSALRMEIEEGKRRRRGRANLNVICNIHQRRRYADARIMLRVRICRH